MSEFTSTQSQGLVANPASMSATDGQTPPSLAGRQAETLTAPIHGKNYVAAYRGNLFMANVTAVTIPAIVNGVVSVFSLYNPVGSGILMELVDFDMAQVLAAVVVDAIGLYFDAGPRAAAATFTTPGTIQAAALGSGLVGKGKFYSALTHVNSAGWARCAIVGNYGAATDAAEPVMHYEFNGKLIIPEGVIVSVACSTTVGTTSGSDISMSWAEWPK